MKKVIVPIAKTIEDASQDVTKTMTEISKGNDKVLENLNDKLLDIMKHTGILASFFAVSSI